MKRLEISKQDLEKLYNSGLSSRQIGEKFGFSRSTIDRTRIKYNIVSRDSALQQTVLNETKRRILRCYRRKMIYEFLSKIYKYHIPCMKYKFKILGDNICSNQ